MTIEPRPTTEPRSRRAILAGALTGLAGLIAGRAAGPEVTRAASGDPFILGSLTNDAGTASTKLTTSTGSSGTALYVLQNGTGTALRGVANNGIAGFFTSANGTGISGVTAKNNQFGVYGANDAASNGGGEAIRANGQQNHGVVATTANVSAYGVKATNSGLSGAAILGQASATGVSSVGIGVFGQTDGENGSAVYGNASSATGTSVAVYGTAGSPTGTGVLGYATSATGTNYGTYGHASGATGYGAVGYATEGTGINYGAWGGTNSPSGYGVYSSGNAHVQGDLGVSGNLDVTGAITAGTKDFKIDHPLDPGQKFLSHSCVESDDRRTVYDGGVTLDAQGEATVTLPAWFGALNDHTRIQLTPIGSAAPDLHVKVKVADNRFAVAGGAKGQEVYWQLTGIRQDPYARAHPLVVESAKAGTERGRYLHPEVFGNPASKSIDALHARPLPAAAPTRAPAAASGH